MQEYYEPVNYVDVGLDNLNDSRTLLAIYHSRRIDPEKTAIMLKLNGGILIPISRRYDNVSLKDALIEIDEILRDQKPQEVCIGLYVLEGRLIGKAIHHFEYYDRGKANLIEELYKLNSADKNSKVKSTITIQQADTKNQANSRIQRQMFLPPPVKEEILLEKCEQLAKAIKVVLETVKREISSNQAAYRAVSSILHCLRYNTLDDLESYLSPNIFAAINQQPAIQAQIAEIQQLATPDSQALFKAAKTAMNRKAAEVDESEQCTIS